MVRKGVAVRRYEARMRGYWGNPREVFARVMGDILDTSYSYDRLRGVGTANHPRDEPWSYQDLEGFRQRINDVLEQHAGPEAIAARPQPPLAGMQRTGPALVNATDAELEAAAAPLRPRPPVQHHGQPMHSPRARPGPMGRSTVDDSAGWETLRSGLLDELRATGRTRETEMSDSPSGGSPPGPPLPAPPAGPTPEEPRRQAMDAHARVERARGAYHATWRGDELTGRPAQRLAEQRLNPPQAAWQKEMADDLTGPARSAEDELAAAMAHRASTRRALGPAHASHDLPWEADHETAPGAGHGAGGHRPAKVAEHDLQMRMLRAASYRQTREDMLTLRGQMQATQDMQRTMREQGMDVPYGEMSESLYEAQRAFTEAFDRERRHPGRWELAPDQDWLRTGEELAHHQGLHSALAARGWAATPHELRELALAQRAHHEAMSRRPGGAAPLVQDKKKQEEAPDMRRARLVYADPDQYPAPLATAQHALAGFLAELAHRYGRGAQPQTFAEKVRLNMLRAERDAASQQRPVQETASVGALVRLRRPVREEELEGEPEMPEGWFTLQGANDEALNVYAQDGIVQAGDVARGARVSDLMFHHGQTEGGNVQRYEAGSAPQGYLPQPDLANLPPAPPLGRATVGQQYGGAMEARRRAGAIPQRMGGQAPQPRAMQSPVPFDEFTHSQAAFNINGQQEPPPPAPRERRLFPRAGGRTPTPAPTPKPAAAPSTPAPAAPPAPKPLLSRPANTTSGTEG